MKRISANILIAVAFLFPTQANATAISGRVVDRITGGPLAGATVQIEDQSPGILTELDGSFALTDIFEPRVRLVIRSLGYELEKLTLDTGAADVIIEMSPIYLPGQDIIVTGDRARRRETPVAFTNISQREIEQSYWAQDIPMLLTQAPGVYAYSDNGLGVGYSYVSVRGFSQRRVSVIINGVPHNDPESHEVYWVDMPDFAASVQDIQVQRGVGSSMYGSSSIGGTININTSYSQPTKEITLNAGFGSFGTRKTSLNFNSGLIDNSYNVYGRFSRLVSDGYRDRSWTDQWAYFLGVVRYDENLTNRFQVYGGKERTHLAYKGIPREKLADDRRFNPFEFDGEIDQFEQPHYELLTNWQVNDDLEFQNTLFYIKGEGFYDQFRAGRSYSEYNLTEFVDGSGQEIDETDLVRRRFIENDFWGVVPRLTYKKDKLRLALGVELNSHRGVHTGSIIWAEMLPPDSVQDVGPSHRYYDYEGRKLSASAFLNAEYSWSDLITTMTAFQYQYRRYQLLHEHRNGVHHTTPYHIVSPRFGVNFNVSSNVSVFANAAYTSQEPAADEIYDPQDYWSSPADFFENYNTTTGEGSDPIMGTEKLIDLELGAGYRTRNYAGEINLYWMRFNDEIVYNGGISEDGIPLRTNAPASIHRGIELSGRAKPHPAWEITGNFSYADNYFDEFNEYVTDWSDWPPPIEITSRAGNTIAGFPNILGNFRLTYQRDPIVLSGHIFHAGRIYLDNSNDDQISVDPHTLVNLSVKVTPSLPASWPTISLEGRVNNAFDEEYETGGYVDEVPLWIVGAERNFYLTAIIDL